MNNDLEPVTHVKKPKVLSKPDWQPLAERAAVVVLALMVGMELGRWSKETRIYTNLPYEEMPRELLIKWPTAHIRQDGAGFWQEKIAAFLKPGPSPERRPHAKADSWWDRYHEFTEKHQISAKRDWHLLSSTQAFFYSRLLPGGLSGMVCGWLYRPSEGN